MELLFLGSGTSTGVPLIGCHCDVCSSTDPRDQRTRPSVVISYGKTRVLIDTTPEMRLQCCNNGVDMIDAVVFTHPHADHIFGLDDVRRFNILKEGTLDAWADEKTHKRLYECFHYAFFEPKPHMRALRPKLVPRIVTGPFEIAGQTWTPLTLQHDDITTLGYRVGKLAYCTDVSSIPEETFEKLGGLDVLILGALGPKAHPAHFSIEQALVAIDRIKPKRCFFTHIGHLVKHATTETELPPHVRLGYDGLRVTASL